MKWLFVSAFLALMAHAAFGQGVEMGSGLVCDESKQVHAYLDTVKDDPQATVKEINQAFNSEHACVLAHVAYIKGTELETVSNKDGVWKITEILVLAVGTAMGWQRIKPAPYFSAFKSEDKGA